MSKERLSGYYWCKDKFSLQWEISWWDGQVWYAIKEYKLIIGYEWNEIDETPVNYQRLKHVGFGGQRSD